MTTGAIYINNKDIYTKYGVYVTEGGYNDLVTMPPTKSVISNEWAEYQGAEVEVASIVLSKREPSIRFATARNQGYKSFLEMLSSNGKIVWHFEELKRNYTLRYLSISSVSHINGLTTFTIKFSWDEPGEQYDGTAKQNTITLAEDKYNIDGVEMSAYNISVIGNVTNSMMTAPGIKNNFEQDCSTIPGVRCGAILKPGTTDVKVRCLMRATGITELWHNYDALLHDISTPVAHTFTRISDSSSFKFYYKSCSVNSFYASGKVWIDFTLTLCNYENIQ